MTRTLLLGNLPTFQTGINKGRLNRKLTAKKLGLTLLELSKAYNNWIQIFRKPNSTLTFEQYCTKLTDANIRPFDVGCTFGKYCLSRYTDDGPYTDASCRFIPLEENLAEQQINQKFGHRFKPGYTPWNKRVKG